MFNKKRLVFILSACLLIALFIFSSNAFASNYPRIFVNGNELITDASVEMKNNTVTGSVRAIAEALGANVHWNEADNSVEITNKQPVTKEQVSNLISSQGKTGSYYFDGLTYELVNLDNDEDLEIVAKIDGAVHIGNFFVFDKSEDGNYKLVEEKGWKVESPNLNHPIYINEKKVFETVERTGGTGLDTFISHLWYLEDGKMVEAWQGILKDRNAMLRNNYYLIVGGFQIITDGTIYEKGSSNGKYILYYSQTKYNLDNDVETIIGDPVTNVKIFTFDEKIFK